MPKKKRLSDDEVTRLREALARQSRVTRERDIRDAERKVRKIERENKCSNVTRTARGE